MLSTATAYIDLDRLKANLANIRSRTRGRIMAMVKGNAYGHGLVPVAKSLDASDGLAVARLDEALQLRQAGIRQRVLLLGTLLNARDIADCSLLNIDVTVHDRATFEVVCAQATAFPLRVWLELDSGMRRLGLNAEEFLEFDRVLSSHPGIIERIHMTHFCNADAEDLATTDRQLRFFRSVHERTRGALTSVANSAALLRSQETHADWVRPGIVLYGVEPSTHLVGSGASAVMTLKSKVLAVREIGPGIPVGYSGRWVSSRKSRIATVGIGYGDGYPRHATDGTPVFVCGERASLVGIVSMDSLTVDITDLDPVHVGDDVTLWGSELPVAQIAAMAQTIPYQLLVSVTNRVNRIYVGGP